MKKVVKFLSVAFLGSFLIVASALASDEKVNAKESENSIRGQLASVLSRVSFEDESVVYVYFSVSSKNGFEVENVAGLDEQLASAVKATLKTKSIAVPADLDGKYLIKVSFIKK